MLTPTSAEMGCGSESGSATNVNWILGRARRRWDGSNFFADPTLGYIVVRHGKGGETRAVSQRFSRSEYDDMSIWSYPVSVETLGGFTVARDDTECDLADIGIHLPIPQRAAWQRDWGASDTRLLIARDGAHRPLAAVSASITRIRALPGHRVYRVERWMRSAHEHADRILVAALKHAARRDPLCLRVSVQPFSFAPDGLAQSTGHLAGLGFARVAVPRMYNKTLMIDLAPAEDALFARLHATARRHVRAPGKKGLVLRPIIDPALADRLAVLYDETFRRSGTVAERLPWKRILERSSATPDESRVVGLFDDASPNAHALVAFAWGTCHGTYATYDAGASARRPDLGNTPLGYAPLWDLVAWARRLPLVTRFDLGGVSTGGEGDPLDGITEFKRYFSNSVVDVSEEWAFEPAPLRAALARVVSEGGRRVLAAGDARDTTAYENARPPTVRRRNTAMNYLTHRVSAVARRITQLDPFGR